MSARVISFGLLPEIPTLFVVEKVDGDPPFRVARMVRASRGRSRPRTTPLMGHGKSMRLAEALCVAGVGRLPSRQGRGASDHT
jgi:hypothetical protein